MASTNASGASHRMAGREEKIRMRTVLLGSPEGALKDAASSRLEGDLPAAGILIWCGCCWSTTRNGWSPRCAAG